MGILNFPEFIPATLTSACCFCSTILSLLLFLESDGVDVVDEKPWTSLLMFDESLTLLDLLDRLSVFRELLQKQGINVLNII